MSTNDDTGANASPGTDGPEIAPRVLHVDDDPGFAELTATRLEHEGLTVEVETDPGAALDRLDDEAFDCVVSDFDMPGMDGLELLESLREGSPEPHRPFILFTGKGSEEIASRAISAGVTDYLQKGSGGTYELLANRVRNAVEAYHSRVRSDRCRRVVQSLEIPIAAVDAEGRIRATNQAMVSLTGRDPDEMAGATVGAVLASGDGAVVTEAIDALHDPDAPRSVQRDLTVETAGGPQRVAVTLNRLRTADDQPAAVCLFGE